MGVIFDGVHVVFEEGEEGEFDVVHLFFGRGEGEFGFL